MKDAYKLAWDTHTETYDNKEEATAAYDLLISGGYSITLTLSPERELVEAIEIAVVNSRDSKDLMRLFDMGQLRTYKTLVEQEFITANDNAMWFHTTEAVSGLISELSS